MIYAYFCLSNILISLFIHNVREMYLTNVEFWLNVCIIGFKQLNISAKSIILDYNEFM